MAGCPAFDPLAPYVGQVVGFVDCHGLALGEDGWRALASASGFGTALTGLLVISVALLGYRTLLGRTPTLRDGVATAVRIGIVLALATQWSAYRPLIYDLATRGPDELASGILAPAGLGAEDRDRLNDRVQGVSVTLASLLHGTTGDESHTSALRTDPATNTQVVGPRAAAPDVPTDVLKSADTSNTLLLVSTLTGEISVRVVIGLLLALGPLFVAGLLFEATQGLFVGWLRILAGSALGAVAVPAAIALELAILEPQVTTLRALLEAQTPYGALPEQILATTAVFALVMLALLVSVILAAAGLRAPRIMLQEAQERWSTARSSTALASATMTYPAADRGAERSRARVIADAARAAQRRDAQLERSGRRLVGMGGSDPDAAETWAFDARTQPSGRRRLARTSPGANSRDSRT